MKRDEVRRYEFLSVVDPLDAWGSRDERLRRVSRYLDRPTGLELLRVGRGPVAARGKKRSGQQQQHHTMDHAFHICLL